MCPAQQSGERDKKWVHILRGPLSGCSQALPFLLKTFDLRVDFFSEMEIKAFFLSSCKIVGQIPVSSGSRTGSVQLKDYLECGCCCWASDNVSPVLCCVPSPSHLPPPNKSHLSDSLLLTSLTSIWNQCLVWVKESGLTITWFVLVLADCLRSRGECGQGGRLDPSWHTQNVRIPVIAQDLLASQVN